MLRFLTAGESHGRGLLTILEGVPAGLAATAEEFAKQFAPGLAAPGPYLIEAVL